MSGVVNTVKSAASTVGSDVGDVWQDVKHGQLLKGAGDIVGTAVDFGASVVSAGALTNTVHGAINPGSGGIIHGAEEGFSNTPLVNGTKNPLPTIAIQDPKAVATQQANSRAAAARQAQIDQQTSTPGRGNTILTDNYSYRT